ncbi:YceD family protein [Speluncibacter jeojiensis]
MLDTSRLGRRPGSMRTIERTVTVDERIGLDLIAIPAGSPIELDLRLESVVEGVLVTGGVRADTEGECSRCLEPTSGELELSLTELFAYPDSVTDETTDEDEAHRVVDELIDLEPVVVGAVGLALPLQPLCSEDCLGLCPECGIRLAIAGSEHGHEILDPRWAALAEKVAGDGDDGGDPQGRHTRDQQNTSSANTDLGSHNEAEEK